MKKKLITLSFKQIVMIVAPLVIIASYSCISFSNIINDIIKSNTMQLAGSMNEKVEYEVIRAFEPPIQALNTLAVHISSYSKHAEIESLVKATAAQYPQCSAFYFGTAEPSSDDGYLLMSDGWQAPASYEHTQRSWFTGAVAARGEMFAGEPYTNAENGKMCISFSRAVYDARGVLLGVVSCDLSLDKLSEIMSGINISPNTKVHIVDQKGTYLTHSDSSAILKKSYFDDSKLDARHKNAATYLNGTAQTFVHGGTFFAVRRLAAAPWYVVIEGPVSDFTGMFSFWFKIILLILAVIIFGNVIFNAAIMNKMRSKEHEVSGLLINEVQNLVVAAKENAATSQEQSAAVKEIVATMEDNNELSENISQKIKDVSGVANKTNSDVADGVRYLEANVAKLREISAANVHTIDGIKELGSKIENIWDIVTLINSVADQAKIIAFNAELEASSAGEAGKNFHIVATEIRRLADGIIDGTKEIKERISEIQQSSDSLILASESGTEKINSGVESATALSERFESIKNASEITAGSAGDITTIIQQQTVASEQILITLKQIAAGVENFSAATENISSASQKLKEIATELNGKQAVEDAEQPVAKDA